MNGRPPDQQDAKRTSSDSDPGACKRRVPFGLAAKRPRFSGCGQAGVG